MNLQARLAKIWAAAIPVLLRAGRLYLFLMLLSLPTFCSFSGGVHGDSHEVVDCLRLPQEWGCVRDTWGHREGFLRFTEGNAEAEQRTERLLRSLALLDQPGDRMEVLPVLPESANGGRSAEQILGMLLGAVILVGFWLLDPLRRLWNRRQRWLVRVGVVVTVALLLQPLVPALQNYRATSKVRDHIASLLPPGQTRVWACWRGSRMGVAVLVHGPIPPTFAEDLTARLQLQAGDSLCVESDSGLPRGPFTPPAAGPQAPSLPFTVVFLTLIAAIVLRFGSGHLTVKRGVSS